MSLIFPYYFLYRLLQLNTKDHFIIYSIIAYRVQPSIFSAKVISGGRLLNIFADDTSLIRGFQLKAVLIQSKAVPESRLCLLVYY